MMEIKSQIIPSEISEGSWGSITKTQILQGEIEGLIIDYISAKGPCLISEAALPGYYIVLLSVKGNAGVEIFKKEHRFTGKAIARIPYGEPYDVRVEDGGELHYLCFRKKMDAADEDIILHDPYQHSHVYVKALSECNAYTEDIKSSKTINRMLLPEGMVPRFCMGSVETTGPDSVAEHEHPMLDQLFFGLENCRCRVSADREEQILTENMMLHIPLGSKHSVSVEEGDILAYIWMDFFFTLEGQRYMNEQHKMEE